MERILSETVGAYIVSRDNIVSSSDCFRILKGVANERLLPLERGDTRDKLCHIQWIQTRL